MLALAALFLTLAPAGSEANPALQGYSNHNDLSRRIQSLGGTEFCHVDSLGRTQGGRDVWLITLGFGEPTKKPGVLIVGNVHAPQVASAEVALRMVEQWGAKAATDPTVRDLLTKFTIYVVPSPSPDASEKAFASPFREALGNAGRTDDDRDGKVGEDPPNDLNGDGWITAMRIADPQGTWIAHPDDPRIMVEANLAKNERGAYRIMIEGIDDDGDEILNEDAADGVRFDRNFPHAYEPFQPGVGLNAVSEIETRAIADFLYERPNIGVVFSFHPSENLFHVWKPDAQAEGAELKTRLLSADSAPMEYLAETYRTAHGATGASARAAESGDFGQWAYFHMGKWSLVSPLWWVPSPSPAPSSETKPDPAKSDGRGADERSALKWFDEQKIDAFVPWTPVDHPGFPGKKVEVGGFKPFYRLNPPVAQLDELATKHCSFISTVTTLWPNLVVEEPKATVLGGSLFRVSAKLKNLGYLPTMPAMGAINQQSYPVQLRLFAGQDAKYLTTRSRVLLKQPIAGLTGEHSLEWLLQLPEGQTIDFRLFVSSPTLPAFDLIVPKVEAK